MNLTFLHFVTVCASLCAKIFYHPKA